MYYHFSRDHESSSFRKLARNKWICQETCDFFFVINLGIFLLKMSAYRNNFDETKYIYIF